MARTSGLDHCAALLLRLRVYARHLREDVHESNLRLYSTAVK